MTPTIFGRWQTRLLLMGTAGIVITVCFALLTRPFPAPFVVLAYVTLFGLAWDVLYNTLQTRRWDRDWPPIFFVFGGIAEAAFLWILMNAGFLWRLVGLRTLPGVPPNLTFGQFAVHYTVVWLITFLILLGPLKIAFLNWRFKGGQWVGRL